MRKYSAKSLFVSGLIASAMLLNLWILVSQGIALSFRDTFSDLQAGRNIDPKQLLGQQKQAELLQNVAGCRTDWTGQIASISLRLHEAEVIEARQGDTSPYLQNASEIVEKGLKCGPYQANLWLLLAQIEFNRSGPSATVIEYLRQNYYLAPNEGSEILARMQFAARIFPFLPPELKEQLLQDIKMAEQTNNKELKAAATAAQSILERYSLEG